MRNRCLDPKSAYFSHYGGRGITLCDRWRESFAAFLADMRVKPLGTSLDSIDVNGNYEPSNCRWATALEQARNTSRTRLTADLVREIHGRFEHGERKSSIARRFGMRLSSTANIIDGRCWKDIRAEGRP
jgi:hypothetical protein